MKEFWGSLNGVLKSLAQGWAGNAAICGLILYVLGYISLRFHLTALGIPGDLEIIDEQYVFQGARFLVFILPWLPTLLVLLLVLAGLGWLAGRLLSACTPGIVRQPVGRWFTWVRGLIDRPNVLLLLASVISLVMIQFVMRQCFQLHDLLLARKLEGAVLLRAVLLDPDGLNTGMYFTLLLAGAAAPAALWWRAGRLVSSTPASAGLRVVSVALILLQALLLPANYGALVADKGVLRVRSVPTRPAPLKDTETAWLVWRGKEWTTYLVRDNAGGRDERLLLTVRSAEVKTIEAVAYQPILHELFGESQ